MDLTTSPLPLPARSPDAHKGDFGRVLVVGGSRGMAGSIALSAIAALKTGSGLVTAAIPNQCLETVAGFHPGVMTIPLPDTPDGQFAQVNDSELVGMFSSRDAVGCGPGMRTDRGAAMIVRRLLDQTEIGKVLDADALNVLADRKLFNSPTLPHDQSRLVLTPHPGELARLVGIPASDREEQIEAAAGLSEKFGMTIVVKGGPTVVVGKETADSPVTRHINPSGNPGMATGGSGDVLTGIISSLLGQGLPALSAARWGVYLHGVAGDIAAERYSQISMTCWEMIECLPVALLRIEAADKPT